MKLQVKSVSSRTIQRKNYNANSFYSFIDLIIIYIFIYYYFHWILLIRYTAPAAQTATYIHILRESTIGKSFAIQSAATKTVSLNIVTSSMFILRTIIIAFFIYFSIKFIGEELWGKRGYYTDFSTKSYSLIPAT